MDALMILTLLSLLQIGRKKVNKALDAGFNPVTNADVLTLLWETKVANKIASVIYYEVLISVAKEKAEAILNECQNSSIIVIGRQDELFPERLKTILNPPALIFIKGNIEIVNNYKTVVVVVESTIDGGTMHTARLCLEQGRLLGCVVPPEKHKGDLSFKGNSELLKDSRTFAIFDEKSLKIFRNIG